MQQTLPMGRITKYIVHTVTELPTVIKQLQDLCHWTQPLLLKKLEIKPDARDVRVKFSRLKKW